MTDNRLTVHRCLPLVGFVLSLLVSAEGLSQESTAEVQPETALTRDAGEQVDQMVTQLVLDSIPHTYEETKDWGHQSERWDGIKFRREGLRIETKRRKKQVNHGTWKKYSARLLNPNKEFDIRLQNMREVGDDTVAFDLNFTAHLGLTARQSKWVKGVQLYSISAEGHARVRLTVAMELTFGTDLVNLPPDLILKPVARNADLTVDSFHIDRVSKLGGEFAQQVTRATRKILDDKIAEKEPKLIEKINRQLAKKQDRLRFSFSDVLESEWGKSFRPLLPGSQSNSASK